MSIHELLATVTPPAAPLEIGSEADWRAVENTLGISLPSDLYSLCVNYGSGHFLGITIYNPFSPLYQATIEQDLELFRSILRSEGSAAVPFSLFPDRPGLLPCGSEVNGGSLFWHVNDQNPERWDLVLMGSGFAWEVKHMSLTSFLAKSFKKELQCIWWDRAWQDVEFVDVVFTPEPLA